MHRFKRHYLLCSLCLSFVVPLMVLDIATPQLNEVISRLFTDNKINEQIPEQIFFLIDRISSESDLSGLASTSTTLLPETSNVNDSQSVWFSDYAFMAKVLYVMVSLALLIRLSRNLFRLFYSAKRGKRTIYNNKKIILIKENFAPFSFGTCIYINENDYNCGLIVDDMIRHEQAHIEQRHSLDIIFIELLITFLWFNPSLYLYRRKIKQNHEFMADEAVLNANNNVTRYQNMLISIISKSGSTGLASSLNYSTIKKRFIMMKKETSQRKARYKKTLLIPAILLAICMFSTHTIANEPPVILTESTDENKTQEEESIVIEKGVSDELFSEYQSLAIVTESPMIPTVSADETKPQEEEFIVLGKGISDELLKEYQSIVNKYIEKDAGEELTWKKTKLSDDESDRLFLLYMQMDIEQRIMQSIHFLGPLNIIETSIPNEREWGMAKEAEILLLNGKEASGSELNSYNRNDFFQYIPNKKEESYQYSFWTKKGREDYLEQYKEKIPLSELMEVKPSASFVVHKYNEDRNKFQIFTENRHR